MSTSTSFVLEIPAASPTETCNFQRAMLAYHTDAWDVAEDLRNGIADIVVVDARAHEAYLEAHVPGAISFPHRTMNVDSVSHLDRDKTYVTYCDGIGCNASTKGAYKLASLGFKVKEMLGGLDFWRRDGNPIATGTARGSIAGSTVDSDAITCNC
jgi:rhodanese-related sulfurtransferase